MSDKQFISNLSATYADVRRLDAKKINLKGKNILEYIEESVPAITHSKDTRETIYENDLWGQWVETKDDGIIVVHDDYLTNPAIALAWLKNVKAVQDNKAYSEITTDSEGNFSGVDEDSVLANIQTEMIKDGSYMFISTPLTSFSGDLSNLVDGFYMFYYTALTSFSGDLSSLVNGTYMFSDSASFTSFSGNLSSLTNGTSMFSSTPLTSFNGDLSNLVKGSKMFSETSFKSFSGDLNNLVHGDSMFDHAPLESFISDLSNLVNGTNMFRSCKLTPQSVMYILESIKNIKEEKAKYTSGEIPWITYDSTTRKYSARFGFMESGDYAYAYNNPKPSIGTISSSNVGLLTLGIDVTNNSETINNQLQTFAEGCLYDSWEELKQEFANKGWTVTFQYGGTDTSITLSEDEQFRGVPVYARLIEVSEEDKDKAEYCTEDGTKYYNIDWGHDVTDYDQYQYFGSLLEACGYFGVIPKKYLEEA